MNAPAPAIAAVTSPYSSSQPPSSKLSSFANIALLLALNDEVDDDEDDDTNDDDNDDDGNNNDNDYDDNEWGIFLSFSEDEHNDHDYNDYSSSPSHMKFNIFHRLL